MAGTEVTDLVQDAGRVAAVAAAAGVDGAVVHASEPVPGELTNMTTQDLVRVRLRCTTGSASVILKVARSPRHSPLWDDIPDAYHEEVLRELPWRTEADVYRSPLGGLLPAGLRLPALYAVDELEDDRLALWIEDVEERRGPWARRDYVTAARGLGRMAGRLPAGGVPAEVPVGPRDLGPYFFGRVTQGTLPLLFDDATWSHPLIAPAVDERLRDDLERLAALAPSLLAGVAGLPRTLSHGDACPQNLLRPVREADTVVAIDWTFAGITSVGMDAGQLLAGHAESGDLDPAELPDLLRAIVAAYAAGLVDEGARVELDDVWFGVAANLVIRSAFTALPIEMLDRPPDNPERFFARRAGYARFLVDLGLAFAGTPDQAGDITRSADGAA